MMLALLLACGPDVRSMYEEEKVRAMAVASDTPAEWKPDLVVGLGDEALGDAVQAVLDDQLSATVKAIPVELPLGAAAKLTPHLSVRKLELRPGQGCESCLHFEATLGGDVDWTLGGMGGKFPGKVTAAGQLQLVVQEGTKVALKPFKVGKVELAAGDLGGFRVSPASQLQDYVRAIVGEQLQPIPLADLGAAGLPIRVLRIKTGEHAVRIEALTNVPGATEATVGDPAADALLVGISESAVTGLLRREAFAKGTVAMDVAIDPRAIHVDGAAFRLDLRLWRLAGTGWWRDYDCAGTLSVQRGKLRLEPGSVNEVEASPNAELVDPLAALAQSQILEAIADNLAQTLPVAESTKLGGVKLRAVATGVRGASGTLILDAALRVPGADR